MNATKPTEPGTRETPRQKVLFLLLDKGVLALVAAAVGFIFSQQLNQTKSVLDYQATLYAQRRAIYEELLVKAQTARDLVLSAYPRTERARPHEPNSPDWRKRLDWVQSEIMLRRGWSPGVGGWALGSDDAAAIESIEEIDRYRKSKALLLSEVADNSIDVFLSQLTRDLEMRIRAEKSARSKKSAVELEAPPGSEEAYRNLLKTIRQSLKIDSMIVG